jgi:hypothetical protein
MPHAVLQAAITPMPSPCPSAYPIPSSGAAIQWLGNTAGSLFPWPAVILVVLGILVFNRGIRRKFFQFMRAIRLKGLKLGVAEFDLEDAREDVKTLFASDVTTVLRSYSATLNDVADGLVDRFNLIQTIGAYYDAIKPYIKDFPPSDFRLTIYIQDPLYRDYLYQLVGYYPGGGGKGRRFSVRYGIIGRCYRTHVSFRIGRLLPKGDQAEVGAHQDSLDAIASTWGLSIEEAIHVKKRPSYVAIPLERNNQTMGVLFMDSDSRDAFEPTPEVDKAGVDKSAVNPGVGADAVKEDALVTILKRELETTEVLLAVLKVSRRLRAFQPRVDLDKITNPDGTA